LRFIADSFFALRGERWRTPAFVSLNTEEK